MPAVRVQPQTVVLGLGLDLVSPDLLANPGTLRSAYNYELDKDGGVRRVGGIERFDGRPAPNDAEFAVLELEEEPTAIALGDTLNGQTSGATGKVIYVSGKTVALTRLTGAFELENLREGMTVVGVIANDAPAISGFVDNALAALAAADYRVDIGQVPGSGPLRGIEALGATVYAWRDSTDGLSLKLHKATSSGWVEVAMLYELPFTAGTAAYAEGSTISKGGVSATVRRVALESGSWSGGTAAGRLIVTAPSPGNFTAGAAAGGGACTISGPATLIILQPGGRVRTDVSNLTSSLDTRRIYGCDGVNREFELGDDILVPLKTGMGSVYATAVKVHKLHVVFGFRGSIQHSSIGTPYQFSPVTGAAELGTGDVISDFVAVGGSSDAAALMALCANSLFVLYGNSSADWNLVKLSDVSGCVPGTAQDAGGVMALDAPGVVRYPATQNFGNFAWDVASRKIGSIAAGQGAKCSVFIPTDSRYRVWLLDGTALSGLVLAGGRVEWTTIDYGRVIECATTREMGGQYRTFVGGSDGWVYEADVGRSFAGDTITALCRPNALAQGAVMALKQYRGGELEVEAGSACRLYVGAEFIDMDEDVAPVEPAMFEQPGSGLRYDVGNYDQAYYDVARVSRRRLPGLEGQGVAVSVSIGSEAADELPHTLRSLTLAYTPLRNVTF